MLTNSILKALNHNIMKKLNVASIIFHFIVITIILWLPSAGGEQPFLLISNPAKFFVIAIAYVIATEVFYATVIDRMVEKQKKEKS